MTGPAIFMLLLGLAVVAWVVARARATRLQTAAPKGAMHSLPSYHGWYVALWALLPACLFLAVWTNVMPGLVTGSVLENPAASALPEDSFSRGAILAEARAIAQGKQAAAFNPLAQPLVQPYRDAQSRFATGGVILSLILAFAGAAYAFTRMRTDFRARTRVERLVMGTLLLASLIAIITTVGIVASLLWESLRFFSMVNPIDFLFGTKWSPQSAALGYGNDDAFGAVPLFWGTIFIGAIIAMAVAIPLGLMSAIYLTQYASSTTRKWMKPILEVLAGVPTVVYGYFAALTIAPALRDLAVSVGIHGASSESALAAGLVMGVMIIPFVSSMADDSIAAVPQAMRDGSLAMGATTSETIKRVLIPAALPGVVGGVLLAVSRAIGETMIVVMAAGLAANLTLNPFSSVTTVTTQIVQLLTGDQEFDSAKTLAAFALGLVLFIVTLLLNIVALRVVKKYREAYE
ncbi:phosphate ABC transporter permease subunit PstC [Sphingobium phenoxybenzoativorans]|uniref:Phosphate transport system permease protein n=1 Tax=Sphingobium phenoxybenzoativorans TaxID=1592790 RepID=A0A975K8Y8_9SPHN|nr:phosphate ABC transporter permease subunit PstC [Sphingobium phenoxybenzoativorans]QUT07005.1 phosphate ABC transporter permease subunit PstC [Sphingobium phenoxybenzoativorans]